MNDSKLPSRRRRRRAVLEYCIGLVWFSTVCAAGANFAWAGGGLALMLGGQRVIQGRWSLLGALLPELARGAPAFDERDVQLRQRAYLIAYRLIYLLCVGALCTAAAWQVLGAPVLTHLHLPVLALALSMFAAFLPSAVLAWIEPDNLD